MGYLTGPAARFGMDRSHNCIIDGGIHMLGFRVEKRQAQAWNIVFQGLRHLSGGL